jgi:hypothetical protein
MHPDIEGLRLIQQDNISSFQMQHFTIFQDQTAHGPIITFDANCILDDICPIMIPWLFQQVG